MLPWRLLLLSLIVVAMPGMATSSVVEHIRLGVGAGVAQVNVNKSGEPAYKSILPIYTLNAGYALNPAWEVGVMLSGSTGKQVSNGNKTINVRLEYRPSVYVRARKFVSDHAGVYGFMTLANVRQREVVNGGSVSHGYLGLGLGAGASWRVTPKYLLDAGLFMQGIALSSRNSALSTYAPTLIVSLNYAFGDEKKEGLLHDEVDQAIESEVMAQTFGAAESTEMELSDQLVLKQKQHDHVDWTMHLEDVDFSFDGEVLNAESRLIVDQIIANLKESPELIIGIVAHTESIGSEQYNLQLSLRRENTVKAYLVNHGIDAWRIKNATGYEELKPVVDHAEPVATASPELESHDQHALKQKQGDHIDWIMHLEDVNFSFDGEVLNAESRLIVDQIIANLKESPELIIGIVAHTESIGSEQYNLQLSLRRENTVKAYLVEHGIDAWRINSKGYGEFQPIADNATEEGRLKNRRVEFRRAK